MQAGRLRDYITIQQSTLASQDVNGAQNPTWTTYAANVPADIRPLDGRERDFAKSFASTVSHKITIRYDPSHTLTTGQNRVKFGSRVFDINAILNENERNRQMTLLCTEIIGPPVQP